MAMSIWYRVQLDVRGRISKDLHFGGVVLRVNPPPMIDETLVEVENSDGDAAPEWIGGGLKAVSLSTTVFENTVIVDGILNAGYQLVIHGDVRDEITFWGSTLLIDGTITADVFATVGNPEAESRTLETLLIPFKFDVELLNPGLLISDSARLDGNLQYKGPVAADIQGEVTGSIDFQANPLMVMPTLEEPGSLSVYFSELGREFTTLLAIGAVAVFAVPRFLDAPLHNLRTRPFSSFSVGMLAFLLSFPVVLSVMVLSVVIIFILRLVNLDGLVVVVGLVLGLVNLGGVSLFYFVAIFVARALVGLALGRFLMRLLYQDREGIMWSLAQLALGLFILAAVVSLPVIGLLFNAAALFIGLGTILNVLVLQFRRWRDAAPVPAPAWYAPAPAVTPPHITAPDRPRAKLMPAHETPSLVTDEDDVEPQAEASETPAPLPTPTVDERYPLVGPGMINLPDGFDFDFFGDSPSDD
ncbi:MAG: hypothetical protein Q9P01_16565 [Anaerolineae bacterium]|nr:hypothetical protein [Anaerolineae bacterium]